MLRRVTTASDPTETPAASSTAACLNCGAALHGAFCCGCGQKASVGRLGTKELAHEVATSAFDLDAALPRTIVDLTLRPGQAVRAWVAGQRKRYVGPAQYFASALALLLLVFAVRHVKASDMGAMRAGTGVHEVNEAVKASLDLVDRHFQFLVMASVPFFSLGAGIVFRRRDVTVPERLVLFAYLVAHGSLLGSVIRLAIGAGSPVSNSIIAVAGLAYYAWGTRGFYGAGWLRSVAAVVVGYTAFIFTFTFSLGLVIFIAVTLSRPGPAAQIAPPAASSDNPGRGGIAAASSWSIVLRDGTNAPVVTWDNGPDDFSEGRVRAGIEVVPIERSREQLTAIQRARGGSD